MFNLENAIADWRQQMIHAGIRDAGALNELEGHLREDVAREVQAGLSVEKAFETATKRMGKSHALAAEFRKAGAAKEGRERRIKLLCIVLTGVCYLLPLALSIPKPWSHMDPGHRYLGLGAVALTMSSMFSGLFLRRFLPVIPEKRIRTRIQFASIIPVFAWLFAFAYVILPGLEPDIGRMTVATLWAISPLAIFSGLAFGLDEAARCATSETAASC